MKPQPHPLNFQTADQMERWFADFQQKAFAICEKYNVPHIFERLKYFKGETEFSMRVHFPPTSNQNELQTVDEIIDLVNEGF